MVIQLKVHSPTGEEKVIKLCDNEEQMEEITVLQLKQMITKTFMIRGEFNYYFFIIIIIIIIIIIFIFNLP